MCNNAVLRGQRGGPGQLPYRYNRFPHEELNALSDPSTGAFDIRDASVLHFAGLKPWNNRAKFGPQAIRAFDRAMASYRRRCQGRGRPHRHSADQLRRDFLLAKSRGRGGGRRGIHLHDLYGEA